MSINFGLRRQQVCELLPANSAALIAAGPKQLRNGDTEFAYRQHSDFYYLTGFLETNSVLLLQNAENGAKSVLFCEENDPRMAMWDGARLGPDRALSELGVDATYPISRFDELLPSLLSEHCALGYLFAEQEELGDCLRAFIKKVKKQGRAGSHAPHILFDLSAFIHQLRIVKSAEEIELMRSAAHIAAKAHIALMQSCRPGLYEYMLEGQFLNEIMCQGAKTASYSSIVAGGANACTLHYVDNSAELKAGELVLVDAGAEYQHYASDITRTYPVSGVFSTEQRAVYELVLSVQERLIALVKPGLCFNELQQHTVRWITEGLIELGLLKGKLEPLIEEKAYLDFYMHQVSHWLGIDVHDAGVYRSENGWTVLHPGMVLTIEPGIYIASDNDAVAAKWRGIGVRIEDDVLVTETGSDVLSKDVPRTVEKIEALMAG